MKVTKRVHNLWYGDPPLIGKYQYIYDSEDNTKSISLVELPDYYHDGVTLWEIYTLKGNMFEDIERFPSKEEAEKRIIEALH